MRDKRVYLRLGLKLCFLALAVLFCVVCLGPLLNWLAPFVAAFVLAWVLNPLVEWVGARLKLKRKGASALVIIVIFVIVGGLLGYLVYMLVAEAISFAKNWSDIWHSFNSFIDGFIGGGGELAELLPDRLRIALEEIIDSLSDGIYAAVGAAAGTAAETLGSTAKEVPSALLFTVAFIIGSFMISKRYAGFSKWFAERTKNNPDHILNHLKRIVKYAFGGYLRATLIVAAMVAAVTLAGFLVMKIRYAVLLALLMAFLDILPYVGAGLVIFPWMVICIIQGEYITALVLAGVYVCLFIIRNILLPKVLGTQAGISPLLSLVGVFIGFRLDGIWGMVWGPVALMILVGIVRGGILSNTMADIRELLRDVRIKLSKNTGG